MTKEEISEFWKLSRSLANVPEEVNDPAIQFARTTFEALKAKMATEVFSLDAEEVASEIPMDFETAVGYLEEALVAFCSLARMLPQLYCDQSIKNIIQNAVKAKEWLHKHSDSLKNFEK